MTASASMEPPSLCPHYELRITLAPQVDLSPLDHARFRVVTGKSDDLTAQDVPGILDACRDLGVEMAVVRCPTNDLRAVHLLEDAGFRLMDTLLLLARDLRVPALPVPEGNSPIRVRTGAAHDTDDVVRVAGRAFRDYDGHYHADPRLDRAACDALYEDWARRSLTVPGIADAVLVAEIDGTVAGFSTVSVTGTDAHGHLDAVDPDHRRRGVYRSLSVARLRWSLDQGCTRTTVSTQVTNRGAQAGMASLGFRPVSSSYTMHGWFRD